MKLTRILAVLALSLCFGCKDNTVTVQVHDLGTYRGKVSQFGVDGNRAPDQSGATIVVEGTTFKATTDATGNFQIDNVPAGIYNLLITKPGYDTDLVSQNQFSGSGTQFLQNEFIQAIPYDSILIVSAGFHRKDSVRFSGDTEHIVYYSLKIHLRNIGPDSLIGVIAEAYNQRSKYHFDIPHPTPITRDISADTTVWSGPWPQHPDLMDSGDSITITTNAYSKEPGSSNAGLSSPYRVTKTFILP